MSLGERWSLALELRKMRREWYYVCLHCVVIQVQSHTDLEWWSLSGDERWLSVPELRKFVRRGKVFFKVCTCQGTQLIATSA